MLRWRLLKYFLAFFPLASVLVSPWSDPFKKEIFNKDDLRYYRFSDGANRTDRIVVKNAGETGLSNVRVQLSFAPSNDSISNFEFSQFESGSRTSFLDLVVEPESLARLEKEHAGDILKIADRHCKIRTLNVIDKTFDSVLFSKFEQLKMPEAMMKPVREKEWGHELWVQKCKQRNISDERCQSLDRIFADWEFSRQSFWLQGYKRWRDTTGVAVNYANYQILPHDNLFFDIELPMKKTAVLDIQYGSPSMKPELTITSLDTKRITKVDKEDLAASSLWFNLNYYRAETVVALVLVGLSVAFAWPALRPAQVLPVFKIFNFAIKTNDDEAWELAFKKHRYYIVVQLKNLLSKLNQTLPLSNEEVFDHLKYSMRGSFGKHSDKFKSDEDLGKYINGQLATLVAVSAYAGT
jgi:hypothetical protein